MPSTKQAAGRQQHWSAGRGFTSLDPERQGEVLGQVRRCAVDSPSPSRQPLVKPAPAWTRVLPDVDSSSYEGSSSRRWR
jgi:hypothetical protein